MLSNESIKWLNMVIDFGSDDDKKHSKEIKSYINELEKIKLDVEDVRSSMKEDYKQFNCEDICIFDNNIT